MTAVTTGYGFGGAPRRAQLYLVAGVVAALALPVLVSLGPGGDGPVREVPADWVAALVLVAVSGLNVEMGRRLAGGLTHAQQPHKALSAWAFTAAMILPTWWLLVVVPLTYAHARGRGLRVPMWKWVGSGAHLVLAGSAAATVPWWVDGGLPNWMEGIGGHGLRVLLLAALVFLVVEAVLFAGSALLNHASDEQWLRAQLRSPSYHLTEAGVVLIGGLLAAVWTGGAWYVLLFVPLHTLLQRAVLVEPLRENAAMSAELVETNRQLREVSEFKSELMGMLAHEVGNPLTSVAGYTEVATQALAGGDSGAAQRALLVVGRNAGQIREVLHDIVALVETDPGGITAQPEATLLAPRLRSAAAAQSERHQPEVRCPEGLVALVQPTHLDQVLANLLGNATKYAGGATLLSATATADGRVVVAVEDHGPGIPVDFRDQVFARRSRHPDTAGTVGGRGLGLHISRALALANGGELRLAESQAGSRFELVLQAPAD